MAYKGKYQPSYPRKYKGNPTNIVYRSLWERKFMVYCDNNERILEWGSEEMYVWYRSPIDNRPHRYFPDFYIKVKESTGAIKKYIIEIKPTDKLNHHQNQKDKQKVIYEAYEYAKNQAKWEAADEWCKDRDEFKVFTEKELGIKYGTIEQHDYLLKHYSD